MDWPIRLMADVAEVSLATGHDPNKLVSVFQPFQHGYNALDLDALTVVELESFKALLISYGSSDSKIYQECISAVTDAVDTITEVIDSKCLH